MSNDHRLPDAKPDATSDAKPDATSDATSDAKPDATSDAKPVVKYPETNAGYKLWLEEAKKKAEEAAKKKAENRCKSTTVVLHWKDLRIYDPPSGEKLFETEDAALKWAKEWFEEWDAWESSPVNTGKWKIVPTDSEGIVKFDPFFGDYSFKKIWWDEYNDNDDYFYIAKEWDEDDEKKEIAKAIAKILRSKAFNLGLGLKLSMRNCCVELADKSV